MTVLHMDCREGMAMFPPDTFDSIVCDPPYELGFMGKAWDASGIANDVEMWRAAYRVLKPGGHLLAFSGSRTYHRMVCAIEDAGFDIRDQIMWVYGSGFPKSLDVSKAIDKRGGNAGLMTEIGKAIQRARLSRRMSAAECDRLFCEGSTNWTWFEGRAAGQRAPSPTTFALIAAAWPELSDYAEAVAEANRDVIGQSIHKSGIANGVKGHRTVGGTVAQHVDITAPATDAARQWEGWGTALKPAHEPICVARKPLIGTVAANVLAYGTGALNIDGCRVGTTREVPASLSKCKTPNGVFGEYGGGAAKELDPNMGRWPANLIHDGSDEVVALFPETKSNNGKGSWRNGVDGNCFGHYEGTENTGGGFGDSGSAARFFYCPKASKNDRGEGNTHPTVKPTELMRYLCRLVTPPGGLILDPFAGSGSTYKAAFLEGFDFFGFDLQADYVAIANARVDALRRAC